jgi:hypothetical protein
MSDTKKRCCVDCLHCKVSAKSTDKVRLCFCSQTVFKELHREMFWFYKVACLKFVSMGTRRISRVKEAV